MTEIEKPDDPHGLIGEHWPALSATACQSVSDHVFGYTVIHGDAASATVPTAAQVADDFRSAAGDSLLSQLHITVADLQKHGASAGRIASLMDQMATRIRTAKQNIRADCLAGTEEIDKAEKKAQSAISTKWQNEIGDRADQLNTEVRQLSSSISSALPGSKPEATGVPVYVVPQADGTISPVNAMGQPVRDGKVLADKPITDVPAKAPAPQTTADTPKPKTAPGTPATSAPSSGSAGGGSPIQPGQMPQMNSPSQPTAVAGTNSGAGSTTATGSNGASSIGDSGSKSDSGSNTPASDTGLLGVPTTLGNQPAAAPSASAAGSATPIVTKAATAVPVAAAAAGAAPTTGLSGLSGMTAPTASPGLSSTAPPGTGVTPGVSTGPGGRSGVLVQPTPAAPAPTAPGATTVSAPGPTPAGGGSGVGTPPPPSPTSGGDGGSRPEARPFPAAWTAASTAVTAADGESVARLTSYVKALPLSDQMAHRRLAALSDQWRRVGWADEQVAVAVFVVDSAVDGKPFPGCVFATSAGVSIIPGGVRLPVGVLPLTRIPGINPDAVAALAGCTDPKAKIEQLTPSKWGRPAALVVIDDVDTQAIITAGDASPAQLAVTSLIRPGLESDQLQGAINAGTFRYGRPGVSESAADLRSLGWSSDGEKPREYDRALREYLFATALASWGTDRRAAAYALGELEGSPEIERD